MDDDSTTIDLGAHEMKTEIRFETCASCDATVAQGETHCGCGRPASLASFSDRAAYEVLQWRAYQERVATVS